jgi:chromosome segregation ATPase
VSSDQQWSSVRTGALREQFRSVEELRAKLAAAEARLVEATRYIIDCDAVADEDERTIDDLKAKLARIREAWEAWDSGESLGTASLRVAIEEA